MNISIQFKLLSYQPGSNGYNNIIFEPTTAFTVSVDVPVKYLVNAEEFLSEPMQGNKQPDPILTLDGWVFVEEKFLNRIKDQTIEISQAESDIEWEDGEE